MAEKKEKKIKIPKKIGTCADLLYTTVQDRLKAQKVVDELKAVESALKSHIIENLPKSNASGVAGKLARVTITKKEVPQVEDWDAFRKYIKTKNRWDFLQKRLSNGAILDTLEDGKKIPGVKSYTVVGVGMNKVS